MSVDTVDTKKVYRLADRLMLKPDGDVTLAFDPQTLAVHQLNATLAAVAERLDGERSTESVVLACSEAWGLDVGATSREVYRSLQILLAESLIEVCE